MHKPDLIFCGGNNEYFCNIALENGYLYGARLPCKVYAPVYFADQDWKSPNRESYMTALRKYSPKISSVLDWERDEQLSEVLSWAEEASQFSDIIIIIPKVLGGIKKIPRKIGKSSIRLGYSVPTTHGATGIPIEEFDGWDVHLLGGSPGAQMRLSRKINVSSADGNMMMKMANRGLFWTRGKKEFSNHWSSLKESDGKRWEGNGNHEAFRRSCVNIIKRWDELYR